MTDRMPCNNVLIENTTLQVEFEKLSTIAVVLMRTNGCLIICLNVMVIICLVAGKAQFPSAYWVQLFSMSINDVIAGVSVLSISFLDSPVFSNSIKLCSASMAFFISSQSATLYSIAVICAYRFIIAKRVNQITADFPKYKIAISVAFAWPVSLICCSVPFALWTPNDNTLVNNGCSMESALQDNLEKLMKVLSGLFVLPLVFTNIMYCGVFIYLRKSWRQVQPSAVSDIHTNTTLSDGDKCIPGTSKSSNRNKSSPEPHSCKDTISKHTDVSNPSRFSKNARIVLGAVNIVNAFHEYSPPQNVFRGSKETQQHNRIHSKSADSQSYTLQDLKHTVPARKHMNKQYTTSTTMTNGIAHIVARRQRKAYVLLGFILLFLNLFTLPGLIVLLMESRLSMWTLTRGIKFPLFTTISCNAWVNPILYTIQVKEFRAILQSGFLYCYSKILNVFLRQNTN